MKTLLFTGSSGFLGSIVMPFLKEEYLVDTLDTLDTYDTSLYNVNLAEQVPELKKRYDIVLHAAGKAHNVPKSDNEKRSFYNVNYHGTKNFCAGLEKHGVPHSLIFISTVAVYGCEEGEQITEEHSLNADTPYGKSKVQAEQFLYDWCERNDVLLTILRPSLLAGRNPPGNLGAMINGITSGRYVSIAGGKARKSIAMAEDIGRLIPYCENKSGIFNLCDDHNPSFRELEKLISSQLNKRPPLGIPMWTAKGLAKVGDLIGSSAINAEKLSKITKSLTFSNKKIKETLGFSPSDVLSNFSIR